jgi:N-acetylglucosaminyl-diphospho-decaprenol L-rhamnosyltransferase
MMDLAIVIVSANSARWLDACLTTVLGHGGGAQMEVIVVDNASEDGTRELVEANFPEVSVVSSPNRGFAAGCNRGLERTSARYALLLNPDVEILDGTFGELVELLDAKPDVGVAGVRQLNSEGGLGHTIHRFPTFTRALGEALFSARWRWHPPWAGERELNDAPYSEETDCDWPTGAFMMVRREVLQSAGLLDERFFLFCEEPDLCKRAKDAGWRVMHMPQMTIVHHEGKHRMRPQMVAQQAYARRQFAEKHFKAPYRIAYLAALGLRYLIRAASSPMWGQDAMVVRSGALAAIRALSGHGEPPFGTPPATAIAAEEPAPALPRGE